MSKKAITEEERAQRIRDNSKRYFYTLKGRSYHLRRNARRRALQRGLAFELEQSWILDKLEKGICDVTGLPFTFKTQEEYGKENNCQPFSPTLDREFSEYGYTHENTRVVVAVYNYAKMHWTDEDVMVMVRAMAQKEKDHSL